MSISIIFDASLSTCAAVLQAIHRPDIGQYGACTRCKHGDASGKHCDHLAAGLHGLPSATMRGFEGACRDGSLHEYQHTKNQHSNQASLNF